MTLKAHALPQKVFFIHMITRDITLRDCLLDLLDNCVDGATKENSRRGVSSPQANEYAGYWAKIRLSPTEFSIEDNCGGISVNDAIDYAFHFGRRSDAPQDGASTIGLYGIGMKRAMFKLGSDISIHSSTTSEAFKVHVNVTQWESQKKLVGNEEQDDWDFDLDEAEQRDPPGTLITITGLHNGIAEEISSRPFLNEFRHVVARDYSFIIERGFHVEVNGMQIQPYVFRLKQGDEFSPLNKTEVHNDVSVRILAGVADISQRIMSVEPGDPKPREADYYGWYVVCNRRVVLAGDKSERTVWGNEGFTEWHSQYYGFMGLVFFESQDLRKLPWTTTKRDIETDDPIYRQALVTMKDVTRVFVQYTNAKKNSLEQAREIETKTPSETLAKLPQSEHLRVPQFASPRMDLTSIQYSRPRSIVKEAKKLLGDRFMPNYKVGELTFDYYMKHEGDDE
jgi:hypothetical protein